MHTLGNSHGHLYQVTCRPGGDTVEFYRCRFGPAEKEFGPWISNRDVRTLQQWRESVDNLNNATPLPAYPKGRWS